MKIQVKLTKEENAEYFKVKKDSVVELDFENEYLYGVVASEIGNASFEAIKAQSVLCRTLAFPFLNKNIPIVDNKTKQSFSAERMNSGIYYQCLRAIQDTKNEKLYYNNKVIDTPAYSASNGGKTTSAKERWGSDRQYLPSINDPWDFAATNGKKTGHGVGMSQRGAAYAAAHGYSYKQILAFYFPQTQILGGETVDKTDIVLQWCKERIGNPYIYGATAQSCTPAYRRARMGQYPEHSESITANCQVLAGESFSCLNCKWANSNGIGKPAYDCAQFTKYGLKQIGINLPSGATSQWNAAGVWTEKGKFANVPKDTLCCVFRDKDGVKQHVGFYYNGLAYHAQGHNYGVVCTTDKQYKSWTHYAVPIGISKKEPAQNDEVIKVLFKAKVVTNSGALNLREAPNGTKVTTIPRGAEVEVLNVDNENWYKIEFNSSVGYCASQYLEKLENEIAQDVQTNDYYLKIPCKSNEEAQLFRDTIIKIAQALS